MQNKAGSSAFGLSAVM